MTKQKRMSAQVITTSALLTALVIILQFIGRYLHFTLFSISLVLVPIVIGAALCGKYIGAWLGFIFGVVVLIGGDAAPFLAINIPGTIITVLVKGTLCGFFAGLFYELLKKKNPSLAVIVAAIVCPIVNTGIFLIGCKLFFYPTIELWAADMGVNALHYMFFYLAGINFIVELVINLVLGPVVIRLLKILKKA